LVLFFKKELPACMTRDIAGFGLVTITMRDLAVLVYAVPDETEETLRVRFEEHRAMLLRRRRPVMCVEADIMCRNAWPAEAREWDLAFSAGIAAGEIDASNPCAFQLVAADIDPAP
jgi:hypothetical protein